MAQINSANVLYDESQSSFVDADSILRLTFSQKVWILWGALLAYGSIFSDLSNAANFNANSNVWWYRWTYAFVVLPGIVHCIAEEYTYYEQPATMEIDDLKVGEKPPLFQHRENRGFGQKLFLIVLNLFQCRIFWETGLSFLWQFETGAYRDARLLRVIFGNFPQILLQMYIAFRQWNADPNFNVASSLSTIGLALINIAFAPNSSPCFEDNRSLTAVEDADSDEE